MRKPPRNRFQISRRRRSHPKKITPIIDSRDVIRGSWLDSLILARLEKRSLRAFRPQTPEERFIRSFAGKTRAFHDRKEIENDQLRRTVELQKTAAGAALDAMVENRPHPTITEGYVKACRRIKECECKLLELEQVKHAIELFDELRHRYRTRNEAIMGIARAVHAYREGTNETAREIRRLKEWMRNDYLFLRWVHADFNDRKEHFLW